VRPGLAAVPQLIAATRGLPRLPLFS